MDIFLQMMLLFVSIAYFVWVIIMLKREMFMLKYAIAWVALGLLGIFFAVYPEAVYSLSGLFGFETPVNFIFFSCMVIIGISSLIFVAALSRQSATITKLIQEVSILKTELELMNDFDRANRERNTDES